MSSFRELGNQKFKAGEYKEAEQFYTQAIAEHSRSDPKVFTNRALTRIRLQDWPGAESDARKAIELYGTKNKNAAMKSHYYLAQALLPQRHVGEALEEAKTAYAICLETHDSSAELIGGFILKAKQAQWQAKETARLREMNETLALVEDLLDAQLQRDLDAVEVKFKAGEIGETGRREEVEELQREAEVRRANIRRGFEDKGVPDSAERVVPDWLIDPITFEVMHDPVVTPTGVSYERVSLLKHIKAVGCDPLTRQPLKPDQLIPNVALKNACAEFLEKNGWAADW
ncbi:uncharacterized protein PV07_04510 [Cladophialophora immunda]|uniref:E3 ubiquitin-protein ligase CHIP n=1 Tax=Cladophialophora immunda TaxID=569365 RepID=A0A0D1ZY72_9EURO|nr:uncharacterized protein PV07_04510 [Cladophialophora immunda]KIW33006.1 hypothetical protein PV07_04510 [Cladophialophora immunda]OQV07070.1 U-box domain-containing protein [Cladophialophora immunda]